MVEERRLDPALPDLSDLPGPEDEPDRTTEGDEGEAIDVESPAPEEPAP